MGDIVAVGGRTAYIDVPVSVDTSSFESNDNLYVFRERAGFALPVDLEVDMSEPGSVNGRPTSFATIPAGTVVDSYYVHFDKVGTSRYYRGIDGYATFDRAIVGLILSNGTMNAADAVLGLPGVIYPTLDTARGVLDNDSITLTGDRRSVSMSFQTAQFVDSLRIITVPEPTFGAGLLLVGLCVWGDRRPTAASRWPWRRRRGGR